jgi:quinol monooxygenase YgiN
MADEIVSVAVLEALPGKEEALLTMLREFYSMVHKKGYSRDVLYRDTVRPDRFLHLRYWKSAETRTEAQADPEVHRYWQMLPQLCLVTVLNESMETVFQS